MPHSLYQLDTGETQIPVLPLNQGIRLEQSGADHGIDVEGPAPVRFLPIANDRFGSAVPVGALDQRTFDRPSTSNGVGRD